MCKDYYSFNNNLYWSLQMLLRQFTQYILCLVLLISSSFALSNTEFTYNVIDGGIEITGCVDECPSDLVIPEEIDEYVVKNIGDNAFRYKDITSVLIPESVNYIGGYAFASNKLEEISIPDSVTYIGSGVFQYNRLTSVTLSNNITKIHNKTFFANPINEITFPPSITSIESLAFKWNQIENLVLSENVKYLGDEAFRGNNIINVEFNDGLESIGQQTFQENQIRLISFPPSVVDISNHAFYRNPLEIVQFLGDKPTIGDNAFAVREEQNAATYWSSPDCELDPLGNYVCEESDNIVILNESADLDITYCADTQGWANVNIFVDEHASNICTDSDPSVCEVQVTKLFSTPFEVLNCDYTLPSPNTPANFSLWDIDQNGSFDALTDGLILLRYAFGLRGDSLVSGAIASDANRTSALDIEVYIESHMP